MFITFEEVVLNSDLYDGHEDQYNRNARKNGVFDRAGFEIGDFIVYFKGNNITESEVIGHVGGGYEVKD